MALDGKILARAKDALKYKKEKNEEALRRRREEVYGKNPRVQEIDEEIRATMAEVISIALAGGDDPERAVEEVQGKNLRLQARRREEIVKAGYPPDYLDERYMCSECHDTGFKDTTPCRCLMEEYKKEQARELSSLRRGEERFELFSLQWYDDAKDPDTGMSDRDFMRIVYAYCRRYAQEFGEKSDNILMTGDPGLGKTYLSACIAGVVADKGYSVVYDTAGAVFSNFEAEKFDRDDDLGTAKSTIKRYLNCDLLILDDLGTEMTTAFTVSALYELINTRLVSGRKTVINTNLPVEEIRTRYSAQIASRLEGEYEVLRFYGRDIRLQKKERKI